MTSFTSTVSLLVLVLATSCFTLPILEEHFSSSSVPSVNDEFTTSQTKEHEMNLFDMRSTFHDATTEFPHFHSERTLNEELDFHPTTSVNQGESEENSSRSPRMFDDLSTSESFTFTTQESLSALEHKQHESTNLSFATAEPKDDSDMDKREFEVELTTNYMPSFTLSSSDVSPRLYTSESSTSTSTSTSTPASTSTSTEKYTGLLKGDTQREEDEEPKKWTKTEKKVTTTRKSKLQSEDKSEEDTKMTTTKRSKVHTEDKSEEDTKDSNFPVAQLDQEPSKNQAIYPDNIMILEKSTDVVTVLPGKLTKPIKTQEKDSSEHEDEHEDDHKPKKSLNQGKKPSFAEKKE